MPAHTAVQELLEGIDSTILRDHTRPSARTVPAPDSRDEWIAAIHDWVIDNGLGQEWEREAKEYRDVISQVHLPPVSKYDQPSMFSDHLGKTLTYKLVAGDDDLYISMKVEVRPSLSYVAVGIIQADDKRENYIYLGEYSLSLPITEDSIKAIVKPAIARFMGKVGALLEGWP